MDTPHLKALYETGRLTKALAEESEGRWHLECIDLWGKSHPLTSNSGRLEELDDLESIRAAAERIGFNDVSILLQ